MKHIFSISYNRRNLNRLQCLQLTHTDVQRVMKFAFYLTSIAISIYRGLLLSLTIPCLYGKGWEAGNLTSVAAGDLRLYGGTGVGDLNNSPRNDGQAKTFQVILPVYCYEPIKMGSKVK